MKNLVKLTVILSIIIAISTILYSFKKSSSKAKALVSCSATCDKSSCSCSGQTSASCKCMLGISFCDCERPIVAATPVQTGKALEFVNLVLSFNTRTGDNVATAMKVIMRNIDAGNGKAVNATIPQLEKSLHELSPAEKEEVKKWYAANGIEANI